VLTSRSSGYAGIRIDSYGEVQFVDQKEFDALHASCVSAFKGYASEAEKTALMLANCTADPMPLPERVKVAIQEKIENTAHDLYLAAKLLLHEAARLGYAFTE
jgi:hypothetical protein